ncbi:hypothetical protein EDO6_02063 [Paenibacillus xylanexedens]|nr:hypothetical protein EDO6_02063 [Paenibacillus xylanexedens]
MKDSETLLQAEDVSQTLKNDLERVQLVIYAYWFAEYHETLNQFSAPPDLMLPEWQQLLRMTSG